MKQTEILSGCGWVSKNIFKNGNPAKIGNFEMIAMATDRFRSGFEPSKVILESAETGHVGEAHKDLDCWEIIPNHSPSSPIVVDDNQENAILSSPTWLEQA